MRLTANASGLNKEADVRQSVNRILIEAKTDEEAEFLAELFQAIRGFIETKTIPGQQ